MTLLSGALVAVALVLLAIGLAVQALTLLYLSIAVSAIALVVVAAAAVGRRRTSLAATPHEAGAPPAGAVAPEERDGAAGPRPQGGPVGDRSEAPLEDDGLDPQDLELGGTVLVVAARPRYHVDGCSYLEGQQVEEVDVLDAREEGFTPCGHCTPDLVLAGSAVGDPPARPESGTSAQRAAAAAAGGPAATEVVVAVPDRGSYHRPQCRLVRGAAGAVELSRAVAVLQGYDACGSCRP